MKVRLRNYAVTEAWHHDGTLERGAYLAGIVGDTPTYKAGSLRRDGAFWITRTVSQQEVESIALVPGEVLVKGGARLTVMNTEDFWDHYEAVAMPSMVHA